MKRIIGLIFLCITCATDVGYANANAHDSIFWKADKGNVTVFVLGVTHFGAREQYPLRGIVTENFDKASLYLTETDSVYSSVAKVRENLKTHYSAKDGKTLGDLLTNPDCEKVQRQDKTIELLDTVFSREISTKLQRASPRAAIHQLSSIAPIYSDLASAPLENTESIESFLKKRGESQKKNYSSFEPESWLAMDLLKQKEQCNLIVGLLNFVVDKAAMGRINEQKRMDLRYWIEGSSRAVKQNNFDLRVSNYPDKGAAAERWMSLRNEIIVRKIADEKTGTIFVCIGAAHLAGDDGIINLLLTNGYRVIPL